MTARQVTGPLQPSAALGSCSTRSTSTTGLSTAVWSRVPVTCIAYLRQSNAVLTVHDHDLNVIMAKALMQPSTRAHSFQWPMRDSTLALTPAVYSPRSAAEPADYEPGSFFYGHRIANRTEARPLLQPLRILFTDRRREPYPTSRDGQTAARREAQGKPTTRKVGPLSGDARQSGASQQGWLRVTSCSMSARVTGVVSVARQP